MWLAHADNGQTAIAYEYEANLCMAGYMRDNGKTARHEDKANCVLLWRAAGISVPGPEDKNPCVQHWGPRGGFMPVPSLLTAHDRVCVCVCGVCVCTRLYVYECSCL